MLDLICRQRQTKGQEVRNTALGGGEAQLKVSDGSIPAILECLQQGGNTPTDLPINIWQMRTLMDEGPAGGEGGEGDRFPLSAKLSYDGEQVYARITNTGATPIDDGLIRFKEQHLRFGRIEPGQTITVDGPLNQADAQGWFLDSEAYRSEPRYINQYQYQDYKLTGWLALAAPPTASRSGGVERRLDRGAVVIYAIARDLPHSPVTLEGRTVPISHTAIYRLLIPQSQVGRTP